MAASGRSLIDPSSVLRLSHHLRLSRRPIPTQTLRHASSRAPVTDKSRILEKPTRFNPPSHGSRRVRPRSYPGPRLSEEERTRQQTKRYPNMMPAEGTFMHSFLTDRRVHLTITLSTLFFLAAYSMIGSFLHTTIYRDQLPPAKGLLSHPFKTLSQFFQVYKMHVAYETEQVAEKRRMKLEDAAKRKEFLREHGVEPGFLTGSWMDKFGTVEGDKWKAERAKKLGGGDHNRMEESSSEDMSPVDPRLAGPMAMAAGSVGAGIPADGNGSAQDFDGEVPSDAKQGREKKKLKMWFGIW